MSVIRVQESDFDVAEELARLRESGAQVGAIASFVGLMRDANDGDDVSAMRLEHYPEMTQRALADIVQQAEARWTLLDVTLIHRVGDLAPGDQIVAVLVASCHRRAAFEACEFIMDFLKTQAPFWKKERRNDGTSRWVSSRASDDHAAERWK